MQLKDHLLHHSIFHQHRAGNTENMKLSRPVPGEVLLQIKGSFFRKLIFSGFSPL